MMKKFLTQIALIAISLLLCCCNNPNQKESEIHNEPKAESIDTTRIDTVDVNQVTDTTVANPESRNVPLKLIVNKLTSTSAPVKVAVYQSGKKFLYPEGRIREFVIKPQGNTARYEFTDLPYGIYAIVVFQDLNNSGVMDKNAFGLPTEQYGLSNNFVPRLGKPDFSDCQFIYDEKNNEQSIDLH